MSDSDRQGVRARDRGERVKDGSICVGYKKSSYLVVCTEEPADVRWLTWLLSALSLASPDGVCALDSLVNEIDFLKLLCLVGFALVLMDAQKSKGGK